LKLKKSSKSSSSKPKSKAPSMGKIPQYKAKTNKLGKVDKKTLNTIGDNVD